MSFFTLWSVASCRWVSSHKRGSLIFQGRIFCQSELTKWSHLSPQVYSFYSNTIQNKRVKTESSREGFI